MTDNVVRVIIRERPTATGLNNNDIIVRHCDKIKNKFFVEDRPFTIGQVFNSEAKQEDVYESIRPLVKKFLDGYSCNCLSYGQSGTGKSFTMGLQWDNLENSNRGIVPRALQEIMDAQGSADDTLIEISFFEIYNERVFDLLSDKPDEHINSKGSKFTGGVKRPLTNLLDAEQILTEGNKNRRTRPTTMNSNSSRSHGIVVIYRKTKNSSSTFYMVDLAGSEGVRRTGHKGEALAEGSHINRGLLGIGNIFKALSDGSCRVPYRDTVLGSVLQDSLNANSFSTLVICISPLKNDVSETINSLTFAQKVMNSKINPKIVLSTVNSECKKRKTFETFETPISVKRPIATSTALMSRPKYRPNFPEIQTPIALRDCSNNPKIFDLQNSQLMESPTVKQCFEALKQKLHKRNIRINSINFTEVDETLTSGSDSGELNTTVIPNVPIKDEKLSMPSELKYPNVPSEADEPHQQIEVNDSNVQSVGDERTVMPSEATETTAPVTKDTSEYMTKEECIRLVEAQLANLTKAKTQLTNTEPPHADHRSDDSDIVTVIERSNIVVPEDEEKEEADGDYVANEFEFRVPGVPSVYVPNATNRRRSIRIQQIAEKRKSIAPKFPSPLAATSKRRRTTLNKTRTKRESIIVQSLTKADHCKSVLDLLNKGDMKALQVLPQIGMKTAYCIITHRSLNGKFTSFKEVAKAPFWRGKGWERFEKANNLK